MPYFWFWEPPTPVLPLEDWRPFVSEMWLWISLVTLGSIALLVVAYRWRIRMFKIRRPADPFRVPTRSWWLGWVVWSTFPGIAVGVVYAIRFGMLPLVINPTWGAITAGVFSWLITLLSFQLLIWIPGITPAKFLYHPRWPWRLGKQTPRPAVPGARS